MAAIANETNVDDAPGRLHTLDDNLADHLLLAIPKKGRLYEQCVALLNKCGIKYRKKARLDIALCTTLKVALVFLPAADIGLYVGQGRIDMGITGQDVVAESGANVCELLQLEFGKCSLCIQAPIHAKISCAKDLAGQRVVTSFVNVTNTYLEGVGIMDKVKVNYVSGSVEVACSLGAADAVVDLVETGDTMRAAGLDIVTEIMKSQAVLIANPHSKFKDLIKIVQSRMEGVVSTERYVMVEYNIARKYLSEAIKITPGKRSPTLSPLENGDWVSVKAMVIKSEENIILDKLQDLGATDILIFHIQNCRV